jgi:hypothetical protein
MQEIFYKYLCFQHGHTRWYLGDEAMVAMRKAQMPCQIGPDHKVIKVESNFVWVEGPGTLFNLSKWGSMVAMDLPEQPETMTKTTFNDRYRSNAKNRRGR